MSNSIQNNKKRIAVFGATGSVGRQTLDVIAAHPEELSLCSVSAHTDAEGLLQICRRFGVQTAALSSSDAICPADSGIQLLTGPNALRQVLSEAVPDLAVICVAGMSGLTLLAECLQRNISVALANKEAIVAGGDVITKLRQESESLLVPLDSEHAALYQCLGDSFDTTGVRQFWITASGGPFLRWSEEQIAQATPAQALAHPTWSMGRKITIDSASLANKGLEVIEAHYLFNMPAERIKVVVQPGSLVHSMVEFDDASVLAQFAPPDMHLPIRRALLGPGIVDSTGTKPLDFWTIGQAAFEAPDPARFPCLPLAYAALEAGGSAPAVFNAADEVAALAFAKRDISFGAIPRLISDALDEFSGERADSIEQILMLDESVRTAVSRHAAHLGRKT